MKFDIACHYVRDITKGTISRCMNCGRPFNYTLLEDKKSKTSIVKREVPRHWNLYKGFYLCDSCKEDKVNDPKRTFEYHGRQIRIDDIDPANYVKLMDNYIKPWKE